MKKKLLIILVVAVLTVTLALTACNRKENVVSDNVSRSVSSFYTGENENFVVTVEVGRRESDFIADGYASNVADFAEITVLPLKTNDLTEIKYSIAGESSTLSGVVKSNEFGEFSSTVDLHFSPLSVTIGDGSEVIELSDVLGGKLTSQDVVNIANQEFKDRIDSEMANGNYQREIYVKLITGDRENYYYYVSYIGAGVDYWALLVNVTDGTIVTKK